ncbi:MAG: hypothetical protein ACTSVB_06355 [Candidatus Heimdallarchaeaceae archaeon]
MKIIKKYYKEEKEEREYIEKCIKEKIPIALHIGLEHVEKRAYVSLIEENNEFEREYSVIEDYKESIIFLLKNGILKIKNPLEKALTERQFKIYYLREMGLSNSQVAELEGKDKSTISYHYKAAKENIERAREVMRQLRDDLGVIEKINLLPLKMINKIKRERRVSKEDLIELIDYYEILIQDEVRRDLYKRQRDPEKIEEGEYEILDISDLLFNVLYLAKRE